MVSQPSLYSKFLDSNGTISLSIAAAVIILFVFVLLIYLNKRVAYNHSKRRHDWYAVPETDRHCRTYLFAAKNKIYSINEKYCWENLQDNSFFHSQMYDERMAFEKTKYSIRNRGSSSSSSDSTVGNVPEEEMSVTKLQRDMAKYARTLSLQEEQLPLATPREDLDDQFSDVQSAFSDSMSGTMGKCGMLEVSFAYDAPVKNMTVHVLQARDMPSTEGRPSYTQVHAVLMPGKKQKQKSRIRHGVNPQYMESFLFNRVTPEDVNNMSVRFRIYGCERMRRQRLIGECIVSFANINFQLQSNIWVPLEPKGSSVINTVSCEVLSLSQSDSTGSVLSMQHGRVPELLLGLSYNGTTGMLAVEIIKGSNFRRFSTTKAPDSYVKIVLLSSTGQELARNKTSVRRGQPNPLFKELFLFQVALFQLSDVTLMIVVYNKKSMKKKERLGWFTLGRTFSGEEELAHWEEMKQVKGQQHARWHVLTEAL